MNLVSHIIKLNNTSNSQWYFKETLAGKIIGKKSGYGDTFFETKEEFLLWFKTHSISTIKNRAFAR